MELISKLDEMGVFCVATITLDNCSFEAKSGDELEAVTMSIQSPAVVGICAADQGPMAAIMQLLQKRGKFYDGSATVNGQDVESMRRKDLEALVATPEDIQLRGRNVEKAVEKALRHFPNALSPDQVDGMLSQLNVDDQAKVRDLTEGQATELEIVLLISRRQPIVVLNYALDVLTEQERNLIQSLLSDFTKKTDSIVILASDDVTTMLDAADHLYYFDSGRLTSARDLTHHNEADRRVVVTGSGFSAEMAVRLGARMLEEAPNETIFLFDGNIQALLPLLEKDSITDVRIEDATGEDELNAY